MLQLLHWEEKVLSRGNLKLEARNIKFNEFDPPTSLFLMSVNSDPA